MFATVGLPWIPPELREDRGEIEAARAGRLPKLVMREDLRSDLHVHATATDGYNTIREMADAARTLGLDYTAITDPSRCVAVARGLTPDRLLSQLEKVDRLNQQKLGVALLKGIEVDILEDGSLDLPDDVFGRLDLVTGAVHSRFDLSCAKQTERILRAMDHPHFTILATPSAGSFRAGNPTMSTCFASFGTPPRAVAISSSTFIPNGSALSGDEAGGLVSINSDSHSVHGFVNLHFGIGQARRGWLEAKDVLHARPLEELRKLLCATL